MNYIPEDVLMHYGMPRRSGRYPYGSGEDPYQHNSRDFLGRVEELRKSGFSFTDEKGKTWTGDTAIAKSLGLSTTQFRTEISLAKDERRMLDVARAKSLKADGKTATEIGKEMGVNESTVRSWLNSESEARMKQAQNTANFIREQIEKKGMIDVGSSNSYELNISKEKFNEALYILQREGYPIYAGRFEQPTNPGQWTTQKVICPKDTPYKDIYQLDKIHPLNEDKYISRDGGDTYEKRFHYPESMDSKRLKIRYKEDGGEDQDGLVELRRGVEDLSLGERTYSQVRILVDGSHYIKGMAVYRDDKEFPPGVDVIFNTNKSKSVPKMDVLKEIKKDPDNPFGSAIKDADQGGQYWYTDKNGKKKLGLINKRADEGDWDEWKDALPSQFLGKQSLNMAKKQLDQAKADKKSEFDAICELTNPTVKKHLLQKFADECDSAAKDLKGAALPGQKYHVILPVPSMKDNEVYAPNYSDGTKLALIRYPHGGTFEIPILTVNNKQPAAKKMIGKDSVDAVCINKKVADRLSGADFDGDTVMCIPTHNGKVKIKNKEPLKGLEGFDAKIKYGAHEVRTDADGTKHYYQNGCEYKIMSKKDTQMKMGIISNLITDMTLAGANDTELAAAVRHSMVVIDANKHKLNYRQSAIDNNIAALHKEYQGKVQGGAATILSKAKSPKDVLKRQGSPRINQKGKSWYDPTKPEGALLYKVADDLEYQVTKVNKRTGEVTTVTKQRTQKSTKMAETDDAYDLVSPARHPMELVYADHANYMKTLANQARKEMVYTGKIAYSTSASKTYAAEVLSLKQKVKDANLNTSRERAATRMATAEINAKKKAGVLTDKDEIKKASAKALTKYRDEVGSIARKNREIKITDREWEAIQAGAISETQLKSILDNTNIASLRERATPRTSKSLNTSQINRIQRLSATSNYTIGEIASKLGVSTSTVSKYLKGAN